ncbi:hypothetical protein CI102_13365 [Trichoderma harzianum]|nr:hypothetical protein CI102_13365 [Trichoderma harzianum]
MVGWAPHHPRTGTGTRWARDAEQGTRHIRSASPSWPVVLYLYGYTEYGAHILWRGFSLHAAQQGRHVAMPAVAVIGLRETENRSNVTALSLLSITICNFLFSFPLTSTLHIHIDSTLAYQCCAIHHFVFFLSRFALLSRC